MNGRPPLRSSRISCDASRYTWTTDSTPLGTLLVDGEPVANVTDFSFNVENSTAGPAYVLDPLGESERDGTVYFDLAELYPETMSRLEDDECS